MKTELCAASLEDLETVTYDSLGTTVRAAMLTGWQIEHPNDDLVRLVRC